MTLTPSQLRSNIYRILDRVIETGEPVLVSRRGKMIRIVPPVEINKLDRLKKIGKFNCDPESLVHMDWSKEWRGLPK
ncbi:MAG: type II toxin-antitoxin system Phd/YefM family antitoxin [Candidatus Omnitrophica bacterium]|nr:type II toxin-antitoxin system Phd/YefM family antitoxin [Candidatus Omnitrophota bacterium]